MKHFITILALLLASSLPAQAEERWFAVELLVFANNNPHGLIGEAWQTPAAAADQGAPHLSDLIASNTGRFSALANMQLRASADKLKRQGQYQLLLHSGWQQRLTEAAPPTRLYVDNGKVLDTSPAFGAAPPVASFGDDAFSGQASARPQGPTYELSGTVAVTLNRYLQLDLDLHYLRLPKANDAAQVRELYRRQESNYLDFRLQESRRLRSKEVHYFDHPAFAALVLITPVSQTPAAPASLQIETLPLGGEPAKDSLQ